MSNFYDNLLLKNKKWVQEKLDLDPEFFSKLAKTQTPPLLWIGCSDSRVPANEITNTQPGEVFVHRNIANLVNHTDMSMLSVLDYAVNHLRVKHIVVCGHYGCGGIQAAMENKSYGILDNWLRHIKDVMRFHSVELENILDFEARQNRLAELNVQEQVIDLSKTSIVQKAWHRGRDLTLHGWVYDIHDGIINDIGVNFHSDKQIEEAFRIDFNFDDH